MSTTWSFMSEVCDVLYTNTGALEAQSAEQTTWTTANAHLGNAWLHDKTDGRGQSQIWTDINGCTSGTAIDNFLSGWDFQDSTKLPQWCMDLVIQLQAAITAHWNDNKDKAGFWNSMAQQMSTMIQSTQAADGATGDAEAKACASMIQNTASAGTVPANAGDAVVSLLANTSSVQAQIAA